MMFDEQPDGDPHGECAAEIHRLAAEVKQLRQDLEFVTEFRILDAKDAQGKLSEVCRERKVLRETLQGIANADWRKWDEEMRSPDEFAKWAKSRAQHTLVAVGAYSDGMTAEDDRRFLELTSGLTHNAR
jgi:hypothetical protein